MIDAGQAATPVQGPFQFSVKLPTWATTTRSHSHLQKRLSGRTQQQTVQKKIIWDEVQGPTKSEVFNPKVGNRTCANKKYACTTTKGATGVGMKRRYNYQGCYENKNEQLDRCKRRAKESNSEMICIQEYAGLILKYQNVPHLLKPVKGQESQLCRS